MLQRDSRTEPTVLHVTNIPTPYRLPQYRAFTNELRELGAQLVVYFIGKGKRPRYWEIPESEFEGLSVIHGRASASIPLRALGITRTIDRLRPSVVVLAWAMDPTALLVLWHCRARSIPFIVYTGETDSAAEQRSYPKIRELFRSQFLRSADGFIVYGTSARRYLNARGVDDRRIAIAINVVDTEFFRRRVEELRGAGLDAEAREHYRQDTGERYTLQLLYVGELLELKGLPLLIQALAHTERRDIALHLVGSGPQEGELRTLCERMDLSSRVYFHGYRQKQDLAGHYAAADAFVFPSLKDVFGLVMVEAAAAGLPVIGSSLAGGTVDVVVDGATGYIVDPYDVAAFANAIVQLADDPSLLRRMGDASKRRALECLTPEVSARGYAEAVTRVLAARRDAHAIVTMSDRLEGMKE